MCVQELFAFAAQDDWISGFEFVFELFQGLALGFGHVGPQKEKTPDAEDDEDEVRPGDPNEVDKDREQQPDQKIDDSS